MENTEEEEIKKYNVFSKVYENIRSEMKNRSRSRFIGSYVISWVAINWKAPMYFLFADVPVTEKLTSAFCKPTVGSWTLPLIGVIIYIVVIPFLEELLVYVNNLFLHPMQLVKLNLEHKSSMNQLGQSIDLEQKRNKLISEMSNENETKKLIDNNKFLSEQLEDLKKVVESKEATIEELKKEIREKKRSGRLMPYYFDDVEIERFKSEPYKSTLLIMYKSKDRMILKMYVSNNAASQMVNAKLLEDNGMSYFLTPEGVSFVENHLL